MEILILIIILIFSVMIHEVAHGLTALRLGDPTAKNAGRLTLNPLKHIDLFGSIILPVICWLLNGFVFAYAKPIPLTIANFKNPKVDLAKARLAGPLVNISLAVVLGLSLRCLTAIGIGSAIPDLVAILTLGTFINIILAMINMIPIPPLDGSGILYIIDLLPLKLIIFFESFGILLALLFIINFSPLILNLTFFVFRLIVGAPMSTG